MPVSDDHRLAISLNLSGGEHSLLLLGVQQVLAPFVEHGEQGVACLMLSPIELDSHS